MFYKMYRDIMVYAGGGEPCKCGEAAFGFALRSKAKDRTLRVLSKARPRPT